jgi:hypothetical protein
MFHLMIQLQMIKFMMFLSHFRKKLTNSRLMKFTIQYNFLIQKKIKLLIYHETELLQLSLIFGIVGSIMMENRTTSISSKFVSKLQYFIPFYQMEKDVNHSLKRSYHQIQDQFLKAINCIWNLSFNSN